LYHCFFCLDTHQPIWRQPRVGDRSFRHITIVICNERHLVINSLSKFEWWNYRENRLIHSWRADQYDRPIPKPYETKSFILPTSYSTREIIYCSFEDEKYELIQLLKPFEQVMFLLDDELLIRNKEKTTDIFSHKEKRVIQTLTLSENYDKLALSRKGHLVTVEQPSFASDPDSERGEVVKIYNKFEGAMLHSFKISSCQDILIEIDWLFIITDIRVMIFDLISKRRLVTLDIGEISTLNTRFFVFKHKIGQKEVEIADFSMKGEKVNQRKRRK